MSNWFYKGLCGCRFVFQPIKHTQFRQTNQLSEDSDLVIKWVCGMVWTSLLQGKCAARATRHHLLSLQSSLTLPSIKDPLTFDYSKVSGLLWSLTPLYDLPRMGIQTTGVQSGEPSRRPRQKGHQQLPLATEGPQHTSANTCGSATLEKLVWIRERRERTRKEGKCWEKQRKWQ